MKLRIFTILFFTIASFAQAQESVFYSNTDTSNVETNKFALEVYNLNYIKDNEYFNFIADGYTLLGTQLHPEFIYNNSSRTRFKAGVFLQKNFGENSIAYAIPSFSFEYRNNKHLFTIGNFSARNNHGLIEPMMASEKILSNEVLETGLQYKYFSDKFYSDLWLNWENYIHKYDEEREIVTAGWSAEYRPFHNFAIPIQLLNTHNGGQINYRFLAPDSTETSVNLFNLSIGAKLSWIGKHSNGWKLEYYILSHLTDTKTVYPFQSGYAHYAAACYDTRNFKFQLGYYHANKFISSKGNDMFQTYTQRVNASYWNGVLDNRYVGLTEPDRSLLFTKLFYETYLAEDVKFGLQLEGFYQLNSSEDMLGIEDNTQGQFDFSLGVYLIFKDVFRIAQ